MGLTSDRKPCVLCDTNMHPQDTFGQCTACRPPERMAPEELQALLRRAEETAASGASLERDHDG